MRYKTISSAIAILLLATPVSAQIIIETPRTTTPTTVITGQQFKQTYVIRFIDLSHMGEEIIVKKEDLDQKFLGTFEVLNFKIEYKTKQGEFLEHWWYLNYTLRIINPKKGPQVIPSFVVPWKHKKSGQQVNDPSIQYSYDLKTEEVHLNYVSTIPSKDPVLTLRDQIDFGFFGMTGLLLNYSSWFLVFVPMGVWLLFLARGFKSSSADSREEEKHLTQSDEPVISDRSKISKRKALKNIRSSIRKLRNAKDEEVRDCVLYVLASLRDFLRIKTGLSVGTTPVEMVVYISKHEKLGSFKESLLALANKASEYQSYMESGSGDAINNISEAAKLCQLMANLRWYNRLFRRR